MSSKNNYLAPNFINGEIISAHGHLNQLVDATNYAMSSVFNWRPVMFSKHWAEYTTHNPQSSRFEINRGTLSGSNGQGTWAFTHGYAYRHKQLFFTGEVGIFRIEFECVATSTEQLWVDLDFYRYRVGEDEVVTTRRRFSRTSSSSLPNIDYFEDELPELDLLPNDYIIVHIFCSRKGEGNHTTSPSNVQFSPIFVGEVDKPGNPSWPPDPPSFNSNTTPTAAQWQAMSDIVMLAIERSLMNNPGFPGVRISYVNSVDRKNRFYVSNRNTELYIDWSISDFRQDDRYGFFIHHSGGTGPLLVSRGNGPVTTWEPWGAPTTATTIKLPAPAPPDSSGGDEVQGLWRNGDDVKIGLWEWCKLGTWDPNASTTEGNGAFINCQRGLNSATPGVGSDLNNAGHAVVTHWTPPGGALRIVDDTESERIVFDWPLDHRGAVQTINEFYRLDLFTNGQESGDTQDGAGWCHGMYEKPDAEPTRIAWQLMKEWSYGDSVGSDISPIADNINKIKDNTEYRNPAALLYDTGGDVIGNGFSFIGEQWGSFEQYLPRYFIRTGRWLHYYSGGHQINWDFSGNYLDDPVDLNIEIRYFDGNLWKAVSLENSTGWHVHDLDSVSNLNIGSPFWLTHSMYAFLDFDP